MQKTYCDQDLPKENVNDTSCSSSISAACLLVIDRQAIKTGFDEGCSQSQMEARGKEKNIKVDLRRDNADKFFFTDPNSRWFEFNQLADRKINMRMDKNEILRNLSERYEVATGFADETATKLIKEEFENKKLYTLKEAGKRINAFINVRIPSWFNLGHKGYLPSDGTSSQIIVEKNETGEIVDYTETNTEWSISEDRKNPHHQNQLECIIACEESQSFNNGLSVMSKRNTKRARQQFVTVNNIINGTGTVLEDEPELKDLTKIERTTVKHHAIKRLAAIMAKLYPEVKKEKKKKKAPALELIVKSLKPEMLKQALEVMEKKHIPKALQYSAVIRMVSNKGGSTDKCCLDGLTNAQLNNLKKRALKMLTTIIAQRYPNQIAGVKSSSRRKKLTDRDLNASYGKRTRLYDEGHKHGDIIIYGKTDSAFLEPTKTISFDELKTARKLNGLKEGTKMMIGDKKNYDEKESINQPQHTCAQLELDNRNPMAVSADEPEYDDAA